MNQTVASSSEMKIIPPEEIPKLTEIKDTPVNSLIDLFAKFQEMGSLCQSENGIGLSAVQVGLPWKAFVVLYPKENRIRYLLDCKYEGMGEKVDSVEGCLSLRSSNGDLKRFLVSRYEKIRLVGKELLTENDLSVVDVDEEIDDYYAIVYQHEVDHHFDKLISEIGKEISVW